MINSNKLITDTHTSDSWISLQTKLYHTNNAMKEQ